jgi:ATP-binding cassette subfamily F protein 3
VSSGARVEGDGLALGVFTQDLAQDLDQEALAVDIVTRKVRELDETLTDEKARAALGALGLTQEKSMRKVGHLSGGEKARVALANFVLIPANLLLLDEPSNHLDISTLKVLTGALKEYEGSVLVISHDQMFLEELEPTHVITVRGGKVTMEERGLRPEDWNDPLDYKQDNQKFASKPVVAVETKKGAVPAAAVMDVKVGKSGKKSGNDAGKMKVNAPKLIPKTEAAIKDQEAELGRIDDELSKIGKKKDGGKLLGELRERRSLVQAKVDKLYADLEELMQFV